MISLKPFGKNPRLYWFSGPNSLLNLADRLAARWPSPIGRMMRLHMAIRKPIYADRI